MVMLGRLPAIVDTGHTVLVVAVVVLVTGLTTLIILPMEVVQAIIHQVQVPVAVLRLIANQNLSQQVTILLEKEL